MPLCLVLQACGLHGNSCFHVVIAVLVDAVVVGFARQRLEIAVELLREGDALRLRIA
jgi:hypothetical protein